MMTFTATVAESTYAVKFVHINAIHMINSYVMRGASESLVVQTLDGVIYRINHCPVDKFW